MVKKHVLIAGMLSCLVSEAKALTLPTIIAQKMDLYQLNGSTYPSGSLPVSVGSATININTAAIESQLIQLNGSVSSMTTNTNGLATEATSTNTLATIQQIAAQSSLTKNVNVVNIPTVTIQGGFQISGSSMSVQNVAGTSLTVRADDLNIRTLSFSRDKVDVSGSSLTVSVAISTIAVTQGSTWIVVSSSLDIRALDFSRDKVDVSGSTITVFGISGSTLNVTIVNVSTVIVQNVVGVSQVGPMSHSITSGTITANIGSTGGVALDSTVASGFRQGQLIGNSTFGVSQVGSFTFSASSPIPVSQNGPLSMSVSSGNIAIGQAGPLVTSISSGTLVVSSGSITSFQGGTWGQAQVGPYTVSASSPVPIAQSGPLTVSASSPVPTSQSGPQTMSISSGNVAVGQASPFSVSASSPFPVAQASPFTFSASSPVPVAQASPFTVSQASVVAVAQSGPFTMHIDSGNVSGSSVTVFGSSVDIRAMLFGRDNVNVSGSSTTVFSSSLDVRGLTFSRDSINISGSSVAVYNLGGSTLPVRVLASDGHPFTDNETNGHVALDVFEISGSSQVTIPIQRKQSLAHSYFSSTSGFVTFSGSAETPLFLFVNLSTNTLAAFLEIIRFSFAANNTGNGVAIFNVYRLPVITSSGTPVGIFPGDVNSGAISQMQAFVSPTVSSNGTIVYTASTAGGTINCPLNQSRIFRPGTKFLVTIDNPANNFSDAVDLEWSEE